MNNFKIHCKVELDTTSVESLIKDYYNKLCPATFFEDGTEQCDEKRSRSFYDLLSLVSYYFEGDRTSELALVLCDMLNRREVGCLLCYTIGKVVFYPISLHKEFWSYRYNLEKDNFSGYGHDGDNLGKDLLSINKIYNLAKEFKNE